MSTIDIQAHALGDPIRLQIVEFLSRREGEVDVKTIAYSLRIGYNKTSYHLGILNKSGLVNVRPNPLNKRVHLYSLNAEEFRRLVGYLQKYAKAVALV